MSSRTVNTVSVGPGAEAGPSATGYRVFALNRREWLWLLAIVAASFWIHFHLRIRGFGEQDEARLLINALSWRTSGAFPTDTYVNRTSPLYLIYLRLALDSGFSTAALPEHLNLISVVVGSAALVPMFLLARVIAADGVTALLATVVYWFVPAFWWGNGYGMPHVPALALMLGSLVCLADALQKTGGAFVVRASGAALLMALAAGLKSDILACGLAFPGLVWFLGGGSRRNFSTALSIPAFALLSTLLVSRCFIPVPQSVTAFASSWSDQFPFDLQALFAAEHWKITIDALGFVFWYASAAAATTCLFLPGRTAPLAQRDRRLVCLVGAWALPTVLFWALIWAHGARHLTAALCPVALLIAIGAVRLLRTAPRSLAALATLVAVNYYSSPVAHHPNLAGPRLFESRIAHQERIDRLMAGCTRFAEDRSSRKLLVGYWAIPYCEYAVLARATRFERRVNVPGVSWDIELWEPGSSLPVLVSVRREPAPRRVPEGFAGWLVWDAELGRSPVRS